MSEVMPDYWPNATQAEIDAIRRAERFDKICKDKAERQRLRDQFAAAALTGLLARGLLQSNLLATDAYKVADAMLKAREATLCGLLERTK